jgi:hypothetical protein
MGPVVIMSAGELGLISPLKGPITSIIASQRTLFDEVTSLRLI